MNTATPATPATPDVPTYSSLVKALMLTFTQQVAAQVKQDVAADIKADNNAAMQGVLALDPAAMEPLITSLIENDGDVTAAITAVVEQVLESVATDSAIDGAIRSHIRDEDHISESDVEDIVERAVNDSNLDDRLTTFLDKYDYPNESRVDEMIGEQVEQKVADHIIDWTATLNETITKMLDARFSSEAFTAQVVKAMLAALTTTVVANSQN